MMSEDDDFMPAKEPRTKKKQWNIQDTKANEDPVCKKKEIGVRVGLQKEATVAVNKQHREHPKQGLVSPISG